MLKSYLPDKRDIALAYECVNKLRDRVNIGHLKAGLNKKDFLETLMNERVCEFAYEEVRWFDMIRYKRVDIFQKTPHRVVITKGSGNQRVQV